MTTSTRRLHRIVLSLAGASALLLVSAARASDPADPTTGEWKTFGNGPSHTGYYPASFGGATIAAGWSKTFGLPLNQVAVSGGRVFLTVNGYFNSGIFAAALSTVDGTELWRYPMPSSFSLNPPTYEAGQVLFQRGNHGSDTYLYALDSTTGALNWAAPHAAQWERYMAPTTFRGGVWVNGGYYGGMYGFDTANGAQRFFFSLPQEDDWTPSYHGGVVYSCVSGILKANDPRTGSDLWTRDLRPPGTTVYSGNVVAVLNGRAFVLVGGNLVGFDLATRTVAWRVTGTFAGTPATDGTAVYALQGSTVKAYSAATGLPAGTYTGTATLISQPLILDDVVLAASANNTFVFDKASYTLRTTFPTGGFVSYAQGVIYTADATGKLATYNVLLANPEPTPSPTPVPTATPTPTPSPTPAFTPTPTPTASPTPNPSPGASPTPTPPPNPSQPLWLDAKAANDIAYFLFAGTTPRIERYSLVAETWLSAINLSGTPTAFSIDASGIYVSFGRRTARLSLDGTTETHLLNTVADVSNSVLGGDFLYLSYGGTSSGSQFTSVNKNTGTVVDAKNYSYSMRGLSIAPTKNKIFGRNTGVSPSDIVQIVTNPNGTLGAQSDSPFHGDYPSATRTYVFPNESKVADDGGIIYNATDLTYVGSFGGTFTDLDFSGDRSVVLRGKTLVGYSNTFLETGRHALAGTPLRIFVSGGSVFSFYQGDDRGVFSVETPLDALVPGTPGEPIDPTGLTYTPDAIHLGNDGIIYLLSRAHFSVFRWSVPERRYLTTIALVEAPTYIAFSTVNNALYLGYPGGKISRIKPSESLTEVPFANLPQSPRGLATAGEFVFACDGSGAWNTHYVFGPEGSLRHQKDWNYFSREYVWSAANRKMYFFRDDTSPNDIIWENIDLEGKLGTMQDSPYHDSTGILHPIRVAPDGSTVLLGSGRVYHAVTLQLVNSLSNNIADADWLNGGLYSVREMSPNLEVQRWNPSYGLQSSRLIAGKPLRLMTVGQKLVVVRLNQGKPGFSELDANLNILFETPSPDPTPSPTATPSPTPTPSATPKPSATPTPSASPTPSPNPTATASASPSPSPAPSASPSPTPPAPGNLLNLSTRLTVQTGDNVLIGGFIITGSEPKKVMVRVSGPSLAMSEKLQNPTLELHQSGAPVIFNDNWRDAQEAEILATTIPPEHDLEPAIVVTLPPGPCTAVVRGFEGSSGIGVVAIYDLERDGSARLANISSRGRVETGDNVMIGGFIVGEGASHAKVVVRARGPSLEAAGVSNSLQDPVLELHDSNGEVITNDDWEAGAKQEIEALGLGLGDRREAAVIATLPPGAYTAVLRGKDGGTGVGLVETYWIR